MKNLINFLTLRSVPASPDLGLLVLRLGFALSLFGLHGWGKLTNFSNMGPNFADPWGLGGSFTLALAVFAEVVCAGLVALGLFTRLSALVCVINMLAAFVIVHGGRLAGQNNGELAFTYLLAFVVILIAGPGRFALDRRLGGTG